jgi:hypothetical protein
MLTLELVVTPELVVILIVATEIAGHGKEMGEVPVSQRDLRSCVGQPLGPELTDRV